MTAAPKLGPLRPGARVALIAPAGPAPPERLELAVALIQSWGLESVVLPSASARHRWAAYLSGADELRADDLQTAWCDPTIDGIFAIRGGYGTIRILDLLDLPAMRAATPKPLYGSSDLTCLHEWLREQLGVPSWFTPMISTGALLDDPEATAGLRAAVIGDPVQQVTAPAAHTLIPGTAEGTLIGGNLSLLAMTIGARTRPPVDNTGTVVLLEDVTEDTYRIDSYLQCLLRSGWFDGVAGVALGSWLDCGPLTEIHELVRDALGPLGIPVAAELGFGHGPAAASLPLGVRARLVAPENEAPRLELPGREELGARTGS